MAKKRSAKKQVRKPAKRHSAKTGEQKPDRWRIVGTYVGEKQFRCGERVGLGFVSQDARRVECVGPSQRKPGKFTVQWVKAEDLADLHLEWSCIGRKQAGVLQELASLQEAAAAARQQK
jgi:hypothetical protein